MGALITFFTPTYNRADILHRCYESLQNQSSYDFKWIVIDDGSTDNTAELVKTWIKKENRFPIEYIYKENQGMYSVFNKAMEIIDTPLCVCFESDDRFAPETMDIVLRNWEIIKDDDHLIGFTTPCIFEDGSIIGKWFPEDLKEMKYYDRFIKYNIPGDKTNVYKTEILKKGAPLPVFEGEKCLNPTYMMYKADRYGYLLVSNEAFCITEYREGGMTDTILWQYYNSPNSFAYMRKEAMQLPGASPKLIYKLNIHYVAECCLAHKLSKAVKESPKKVYTVLAFCPGIVLSFWIRYKNKGKSKN